MVKLTTNQVQFYKDYGYLQVSGIFTEQELAEMSQEYDRLFREHKPNMETKQGALISKADNEECSVLTVHNVEFHSRVFGKLLQNENLLDALEGVMSTPDILLHHTKAHSKPARNEAPYLMHQDYHYFPHKNVSMTAAVIHFDDAHPDNGGLCIYPRSHKLGPLKDVGTVEKGKAFHYMDPKATPVVAKRGDVVFFSYLTVHGSYSNLSDRVRRMLFI
ncbi:ectoine dioxygenase-like isoform X2 [Leguminivora glycinivorella]|uniref:ectoine dioxygenase-like isoform X2 n=1 Tax=Leguminivora glycinivorella TaxID=1035111 RepID=UPI00200DD0A6|nr:ectoine dioxygenase-like isoform X2 [Leguminivora glycinivorella]